MKTLIILVLSILFSASTLKAIEVPDAIKKAFQQKFPTAKKVKWEKEGSNDYEASFLLNGKELSALYSPDGQLKETETEISISEIPKVVVDALNKKYPNVKIDEAAKIERADNSIVYETEVKINKKKTDLLFDQNGNETK
jgi:hypothetical protein